MFTVCVLLRPDGDEPGKVMVWTNPPEPSMFVVNALQVNVVKAVALMVTGWLPWLTISGISQIRALPVQVCLTPTIPVTEKQLLS